MLRSARRTLLATALLCAAAGLHADEPGMLPDIGSSAGEVLTPAQEAQYGAMTLHELRRYNMILDDPLIDGYLQNLGFRLAARSDRPRQPYTFFMVNSRQINAFATLGGYIGVNAGLFLTAEREDEVAAVMAHEIAHVTQRHVLRSVEAAQRDQIPILLATLGAMVAAQQMDSNSSGDATQAALVGGLSLIQQRQINYTRSNESEADRVGIQTLARAGYDPIAMADFFARMERASRGNQGGWNAPEYLRSHPVNTTRVSEAKDRARNLLGCGEVRVGTPTADGSGNADAAAADVQCVAVAAPAMPRPTMPSNPLLSADVIAALHSDATDGNSEMFPWARERMRVLTADSPSAALGEYDRQRRGDADRFSMAQRYGAALARSRANQTDAAQQELLELAADAPAQAALWLQLALAENEFRGGHRALAFQRYDRLLDDMPRNRAVALSYAARLAEDGSVASARKAQELLRPLLPDSGNDPTFQRTFARASEVAGDTVRAGEAHAEAAYLSGRAEDALNQLGALKKRDDLDYYQRARIDSRIASLTPIVLEMRKQGLRPGDMRLGLAPDGSATPDLPTNRLQLHGGVRVQGSAFDSSETDDIFDHRPGHRPTELTAPDPFEPRYGVRRRR